MLNRQLFAKDPLLSTIPNDGVAKVTEPQTEQEWKVLRHELETFVCEGHYRSGLERILATYLKNLDETVQPSVWISGFYGSGKSHFVRVMEFLWRDTVMPDGASARGVVTLPDEIKEHFHELTVGSRKHGGLWSAAGTLGAGAGDSARLALLGIVFRSAHLPTDYPAARFVVWLQKNGFLATVKAAVETAGKKFEAELDNLYVSPLIAHALLSAYPDFAANAADARSLLKAQFPPVHDVTDEEMVSTLADVLSLQSTVPGKLPCTLIVLDELQQFIGENPDRALRVQQVVETCSSRFGSLLVFVATGQAALQGTPQLSKLQGRFSVQVLLSDQDVDRVVREVVLRKAESHKPELQAVLDECSGEIDRHLAGSRIAPVAADRAVWVSDYPLLPTRRRFWERVLRSVDRAGAVGQLRTQLKAVHEASREVAEKPVGTVVAADRIYDQLQTQMLQSGVLLREVDDIICREKDGTPEGTLRSRLCAAIFLIGQLGHDPGVDVGVRATRDVLADLLVEDLRAGSASLRQQIPQALAGMVEHGSLNLVGEEYHLQTREGAEWNIDFRGRLSRLAGDDARLAGDRTAEIKAACAKALHGLSFAQGVSKVPRKLELHFAVEAPPADAAAIPVWIRDEWSASEATVRQEAQAGGSESPLVYVFLPRRSPDQLKTSLAAHAAAIETLQSRAAPSTREGEEAKSGMQTRLQEHRRDLDNLLANILKDGKVFQGGGNEIVAADLRAAVQEAAQASLARLYPQFAEGDDPKWGKVVERVRQGSGDALKFLGYEGEPVKHPVCHQVMGFVGATGSKGSEVRRHFAASPFGWPQDSVDGALLVLVAAEQLRAAQNGAPVGVTKIEQGKIGQTEFRVEGVNLTMPQRLAVRNLLTASGTAFKAGDEAQALPGYVTQMMGDAKAAGGAAPMPPQPDTAHLEMLKSLSGNQLVLAVWEQRDRLTAERTAWQLQARQAEARLPRWAVLQQLLKHASGLPLHHAVEAQVQAIAANRSLLAEPDPLQPLAIRLTDELRAAAQSAWQQYMAVYNQHITNLQGDELWNRLDDHARQQIIALQELQPAPDLKLATEADVLAALDATPLSVWAHKTAALPHRFAEARMDAAKRLEPKAVKMHFPTARLILEEQVDDYLADVKQLMMQHINSGSSVLI